MESDTLRDQVKQVWDELQSQRLPLDEVVNIIVTEFPLNVRRDVIDELFLLVGPTNWQHASQGIPIIIYSSNSPLYGCQTDEYGLVLDPITQGTISEDNLLSYVDVQGKKWCFDKYTLYRYWKLSSKNKIPVNPFTNRPLPDHAVEELEQVSKPLTVTVNNHGKFDIDPLVATTFDIIIDTLRYLPGDILSNVIVHDVLTDGISLYDITYLPTRVSVIEFSSTEDRNRKLLSAYRYFKEHREVNELYDTLYRYIGVFLRLLPFFVDRDITIGGDTTVIGALKLAWESVGGLDKWDAVDVVLENGTHLYELQLHRKLIDVASDEPLMIVPASDNIEDTAQKHAALLQYAWRETDSELIDLLSIEESTKEAVTLPVEEARQRVRYLAKVLYISDWSLEVIAGELSPIMYLTTDAEFAITLFNDAMTELDLIDPNDVKVILKEYYFDDDTINKRAYSHLCGVSNEGPLEWEDIAKLDSVESVKKYPNYFLRQIVRVAVNNCGWKILNYFIDCTMTYGDINSLVGVLISCNQVESKSLEITVSRIEGLMHLIENPNWIVENAIRIDCVWCPVKSVPMLVLSFLLKDNEEAREYASKRLLKKLLDVENTVTEIIMGFSSRKMQDKILIAMIDSPRVNCAVARGASFVVLLDALNHYASKGLADDLINACVKLSKCNLGTTLLEAIDEIDKDEILLKYRCIDSECKDFQAKYREFVEKQAEIFYMIY